MGATANAALEQNARANEDRFEQIEKFCNDALESLEAGDTEKAKARIESAAYTAGQGVRLNIVATQG